VEAFNHSATPAAEAAHPVAAGESVTQLANRRVIRPAKLLAAPAKQTGDSQGFQRDASPPPALSVALASESAAQAVPASSLHIEITSTVTEGTLAIFADRELIFTTNFETATPGGPIRVQHALPTGPHQFRVALYKPDKSLRLEKEGLAEIRSDGSNMLAVHVNHHAKLLIRHEVAMEVAWPAGSATGSERADAAVKSSALMK
jgi:hypothetical protein